MSTKYFFVKPNQENLDPISINSKKVLDFLAKEKFDIAIEEDRFFGIDLVTISKDGSTIGTLDNDEIGVWGFLFTKGSYNHNLRKFITTLNSLLSSYDSKVISELSKEFDNYTGEH